MPADAPKKPGPAGPARPGGGAAGPGAGARPAQPSGGAAQPRMHLAPGQKLPPGAKLPPGFEALVAQQQQGKRQQRQQSFATSDPFGPAGPMPKFGKLQLWQKIMIGVCVLMIAGVAVVVFATDLIRVPGIETGVLIRHNADFLGATITLPRKPLNATWQMLPHDPDGNQVGGGTAWRIRAVLEFAPADAEAVLAAARARPKPAGEALARASWFPEPVRDAMDAHPTETYAADDFFNTLYTHGTLGHVEGTNYFLLELYSDN